MHAALRCTADERAFGFETDDVLVFTVPKPSDMSTHDSGVELDDEVGYLDAITGLQDPEAHHVAVDEHAVTRRADLEHPSITLASYLGVVARDRRAAELDLAVGVPADTDVATLETVASQLAAPLKDLELCHWNPP